MASSTFSKVSHVSSYTCMAYGVYHGLCFPLTAPFCIFQLHPCREIKVCVAPKVPKVHAFGLCDLYLGFKFIFRIFQLQCAAWPADQHKNLF